MKRIVIIAAALITTSFGFAYASNSLLDLREAGKCEHGTRCIHCKGTGWNGAFKCIPCKGSGANSSY